MIIIAALILVRALVPWKRIVVDAAADVVLHTLWINSNCLSTLFVHPGTGLTCDRLGPCGLVSLQVFLIIQYTINHFLLLAIIFRSLIISTLKASFAISRIQRSSFAKLFPFLQLLFLCFCAIECRTHVFKYLFHWIQCVYIAHVWLILMLLFLLVYIIEHTLALRHILSLFLRTSVQDGECTHIRKLVHLLRRLCLLLKAGTLCTSCQAGRFPTKVSGKLIILVNYSILFHGKRVYAAENIDFCHISIKSFILFNIFI